MKEKALEIKNLTKRYGEIAAVDNVSFEIEAGQCFGFLGPNGAGKTTTINCITGISNLSEGQIKVFGFDVVKQYREARRQIGFCPQEFNVDVFSGPKRILNYIAGYYGLTKKERIPRIKEILERFGLEPFADRSFIALSGGLKRRMMLARAMVHDPEFLILDEPTAGLDVESKHELWQYLKELNKKGKTILLTSHYLEEVELLCDRIAIINKGKIVAIGRKEEFLKDGKSLEKVYLELTRNKYEI